MCDPISGYANIKGEIRIAHPVSHSSTQQILGLTLTAAEEWSEWEYTAKGLTVRNTRGKSAAGIKAALLTRWPTREACIAECRPMWEAHGNYLVETEEDAARVPEEVAGDIYWPGAVAWPCRAKTVGGDLYLDGLTSAEGLTLPQTVGGGLYLGGLTSAEGLTLPQTVGGYLDLSGLTSAEGLTLPQTVGSYLYLSGLTRAEAARLSKAVGR